MILLIRFMDWATASADNLATVNICLSSAAIVLCCLGGCKKRVR